MIYGIGKQGVPSMLTGFPHGFCGAVECGSGCADRGMVRSGSDSANDREPVSVADLIGVVADVVWISCAER